MNIEDIFTLKGKVALVTGGSRGIGLMIARGFLAAGAKVYISSRKADVCNHVAAELGAEGGICVSLPADLSTKDECQRLSEEVSRREEALHILVNNAGANWGAPLEDYPDSAWDKVYALNVKGIFNLTRSCLPLLRKAARKEDPARVINIGSVDGLKPPRMENYAYAVSKAAVHHLTRVLASRFKGDLITVNAIAPGPFESKMMAATLAQFREIIESSVPLGRIGAPEDMAGVSIFLASKAGAYLTGAVIPCDGGLAEI